MLATAAPFIANAQNNRLFKPSDVHLLCTKRLL